MPLDPLTLIVINIANLLAMSITLPFIMGQNLSPAARDARRALMLNGVAWLALVFSGFWRTQWPDWVLSSLALCLFSASQWLTFTALTHWLGPRPLGRTLAVLCVLMPLGYTLTFDSYPVRVGWSNLLLAAQMLIVARATLHPAPEAPLARGQSSWRLFMGGSLLVMAVLTATRGVLGAWFTELYPYFRAPTPLNIVALIAANITLVLGNIAVLVAWREEAELKLRAMVVTDPLTGLLNRNGWAEQVDKILRHVRRHEMPISLVMIDLDHFKRINDTHGHESGDAALAYFGRLLKHCARAGDVCARLGGEEFCVLLAHADTEAAKGFDRRLRTELAATVTRELSFPLDFSSGQALYVSKNESFESLMARADVALYRAKNSGRGHMALASEPRPATIVPAPAPGAPAQPHLGV